MVVIYTTTPPVRPSRTLTISGKVLYGIAVIGERDAPVVTIALSPPPATLEGAPFNSNPRSGETRPERAFLFCGRDPAEMGPSPDACVVCGARSACADDSPVILSFVDCTDLSHRRQLFENTMKSETRQLVFS